MSQGDLVSADLKGSTKNRIEEIMNSGLRSRLQEDDSDISLNKTKQKICNYCVY